MCSSRQQMKLVQLLLCFSSSPHTLQPLEMSASLSGRATYMYICVCVIIHLLVKKMRMCCICNSKLLVFYLESSVSGLSCPF